MMLNALELAGAGWRVFPCWWSGEQAKSPLVQNGFHAATTDPDQITRWWTSWPKAMIGCPVPIGMVVLDIDPYHGGSIDALEAITGVLPPTLTTWSGRGDGGRHLYFRISPEVVLTSSRLPVGVDLRAGGKAYCIVAPSLHPVTGQPYCWEGTEAAVLPGQAIRALMPAPVRRAPSPSVGGNGAGLVRTVAEAAEGNRNRALFWAARAAAEEGLLDQLEADLAAAARSVGLSDTEIRRTLNSAARAVIA